MIPTSLYDSYTTALSENDRQCRAALAAIMQQVDATDAYAVRDALLGAYPALVKLYGTRAAQVALEFYAGVRESQGVASAFAASLPAESEIYDESECVADVHREVGGLFSGKSTVDSFTSTMQGLATKRAMGMADETVNALAAADPARPKVALVAHPGACGWCVMLSSRGFTNTDENMSHMRHDACKCATVADFDTKSPALKGYDPEAMYQLYRESCTDEDVKRWRDEWDAMTLDERAKYVRRTRDRTGMVKEHPGDWSTFVRNRTAQNMNRLMRDSGFKGGSEELATWLPGQRTAMAVNRVKKDNPEAYADWQNSVSRVETLKTSQSIRQHVPGTKEHEKAESASWFYVEESESVEQRVETVRRMIDDNVGRGVPGVDKNGGWNHKERVDTGGTIGVDGLSRTETKAMVIHYGKDKVHAAPTYDGSGKRIDSD